MKTRCCASLLLASFVSNSYSEIANVADNALCPPAVPGMAPAPLPEPHFVQPKAFDFLKLVPAPPARDTVLGRAELDVVRNAEAWRTPEEIAWAKLVDTDCVFNLAPMLGPWFAREKLPATDAFFKDLGDDLKVIDRASKAPFQRPRPYVVDPALKPCVRVPTTSSYPSGSAMQAFVWSELLAEIFPEQRTALLSRARRAAWGRVLGGVHYPSDLTAGEDLARPFLDECRKSAAFREGWERAQKEILAAAKR